jgi:tripartite-type tricarboxylate transporter receptor subunit TctC
LIASRCADAAAEKNVPREEFVRCFARRLLTTALALFGPLSAARAGDFYAGKQIDWILSAGAGGGYATYAQAFAPYLSAHIPGKPNIVIQNMTGAGGIRAMQYFYTNAPKDGTTIGLVHSSVPFAPLFGIKGANFDPRKMQWIGSLNATDAICVSWKVSGMTTWNDLLNKTFLVGSTGAGSQMETMPDMINQLFGTKMKVISGYTGGSDVYLAMERGEVQGRCGGGLVSSIRSTRPSWFDKHLITVPVVVSMRRNPLFPDAPALGELAKDQRTRDVLQLILVPNELDRPILAPPGVPADRIAILRTAFHDAMNDPGFIAQAAKEKLEIKEVDSAQVAKVIDDAFALPPDIVKEAEAAMKLTGSSSNQ